MIDSIFNMMNRKLTGFALRLMILFLGIEPLIAGDLYVDGEALVVYKKNISFAKATTGLQQRAVQMKNHYPNLSRQREKVVALVRNNKKTTVELIQELQNDPDIETVEPNYYRRLSAPLAEGDPDFSQLWGLRNTGQTVNFSAGTNGADVKFLDAWRLARPTSNEVVIAVIDSGIDPTHPDLASNLWSNALEIPDNNIDDDNNGYIDDTQGYDFVLSTGKLTDAGQHGTHVAGTAAASGRNHIGGIGVQFKAKILPLKVSSDGQFIISSAAIAAYDYCTSLKQRGVNIVTANASFGGTTFSASEFNAISAMRDAGIVLCAAAGNESVNNDLIPSYPANYNLSNIISVASLTQAQQLSSFSNFGATTVDIAAPGSNIYSTRPVKDAQRVVRVVIGNTTYNAEEIEFSGRTVTNGVTAQIYHCGLGNISEFPPAVAGNIALISRGVLTFAQKVSNAMSAGAIAAVIYDNTASSITASLWTLATAANWIPALRITQADGLAIVAMNLPTQATAENSRILSTAYQFLSGTSMASPHVAGAIAFAAWNFPNETMPQRMNRILNNADNVTALSEKVINNASLNLVKIVDTDADFLPDWWEIEFFGNLNQGSDQDFDQDGFSHRNEFIAGTSPLAADSKPNFSQFLIDGANYKLSFPTLTERAYQVQGSTNLIDWQNLGTTQSGTGNILEHLDPLPSPPSKRFYRLNIHQE